VAAVRGGRRRHCSSPGVFVPPRLEKTSSNRMDLQQLQQPLRRFSLFVKIENYKILLSNPKDYIFTNHSLTHKTHLSSSYFPYPFFFLPLSFILPWMKHRNPHAVAGRFLPPPAVIHHWPPAAPSLLGSKFLLGCIG
jgi:hypothetical protein